jgi:hypothetical protein
MRTPLLILAAVPASSLGGCGCNTVQTTDEQVKANWSEVVNQYQRRAGIWRQCPVGPVSPVSPVSLTHLSSSSRLVMPRKPSSA